MSIHKVISNNMYSDTCFNIVLERNDIEYSPGSCASIKGKSYSFCSSPLNTNTISFIIRKFNNGIVSNYLASCKPGDDVEIESVFTFFYPGACENDYCYIATGTGIAPFISAMHTYKKKPTTILYGARTYNDIYEREFLKTNSGQIFFAISKSPFEHNKEKRITEHLDKLPINDKTTYYICGIENMITEVSKYLCDKGINYSNIQQEMFYMSL